MLIPAATAFALWLVLLALPWRPWGCAERIEPDGDDGGPFDRLMSRVPAPKGDEGGSFDQVTVLVPARNEAAVLGATLGALAAIAPAIRVIVIDDQSTDGTAEVAAHRGLRNLRVIAGTPPPDGWTGKLWALQQGLDAVTTPRVLLLDADILLAPGMLPALLRAADAGNVLVSVCAEPCWHGWGARWLLPAFVYFFKLLYPFALANRRGARIAAAAGGVVLVERAALIDAGGFHAWRGAIIDDCTLAARLKQAGHRCRIGLTQGATSLRHANVADIAHMVARTAFVQLHESWLLLLAASAVMILGFWIPVLAVIIGDPGTRVVGALAWLVMALCYLPTLIYYRRNPLAAVALPLTATFFLVAMWYSALRTLTGTRSAWKGRRYRRGLT